MEGEWKQRRGKAVHHWGKMMNDELAAIAGKYEELVGGLQEKYGIAEEEAKRQVDEFKKKVRQLKESNLKLIHAQKVLSQRNKPGKSSATKKKAEKNMPERKNVSLKSSAKRKMRTRSTG